MLFIIIFIFVPCHIAFFLTSYMFGYKTLATFTSQCVPNDTVSQCYSTYRKYMSTWFGYEI